MPQVDLKQYETMNPADLEMRRRAIVQKANGSHDNLEIEELHELAAITGVLRRKASGPPKEAKKTSTGTRKPKAEKATIDDLA
jgi:hypothetical protein